LLAEQEARTSLLRERARARLPQTADPVTAGAYDDPQEGPSSVAEEHVNLFRDLEAGETTHADNKERDAEKKREQEDYEKKIGLLTYLGQDTHELTGERAWWQKAPSELPGSSGGRYDSHVDVDEATTSSSAAATERSRKDAALKDAQDPLQDVRRYLGTSGVRGYIDAAKKKASQRKSNSEKVKEKKKGKRRRRQRSDSSSSNSSDGGEDGHRKRKKTKKAKAKSKKRKKTSKKKVKGLKKKIRKKGSRDRSSAASESDSDSSTSTSSFNDPQSSDDVEAKRRKLDRLRLERLERERAERTRQQRLLRGQDPDGKDEKAKEEEESKKSSQRKYNSQFNPEIARQNKLDAGKKYWLE
jgi:hypothetical protein